MILYRNIAFLLGISLMAAGDVWAQSLPLRIKPPKKEKERQTQALPLPPEPPAAVMAATGKLSFDLSPLSAKGLLTQQVHDALKALDRANGGAAFVKLRAFVAGTGDMRRVATIVSEELSDKKRPLPAVTTIQVGALPMEGAQVVIESISAGKKTLNPNGLAFFSARRAADAGGALKKLAQAATPAGATMLEVTCFLSAVAQVEGGRAVASAAFPQAAVNFVQLTRLAVEPEAACEGIGRLKRRPNNPVEFLDAGGGVLVTRPRLVFTGAQMAFEDSEKDLRLAYDRLGRALEGMRAAYADSLAVGVYSLDRRTADRMAAVAPEFLGRSARPAVSTQVVEGLPSLDATAAIELVAAGP